MQEVPTDHIPIGESESEPTVTPELITNEEELIEAFGHPDSDGPMVDAVRQWMDDNPEPPKYLQDAFGKNSLRIVVFGGSDRLGDHVAISKEFVMQPVSQVTFPDNNFEAGIVAASSDILIFDVAAVNFGSMLELVSTAKEYMPRVIIVALLEPGLHQNSLPNCGIHLSIPEPFTTKSVVRDIEHLMFGGCRGGKDGECTWESCPQRRDGEPVRSGRHCPLDRIDPEE